MTHYICTGECNGISEQPGMCQAIDCSKHDEPLVTCECTDDQHNEHLNPDDSGESTDGESE